MYSDKKILIGLSGGINSMAVLCWLVESGLIPSELHLFYAHFKQHSPDTFQFVADGIRYARKNFPNVKVKITRNCIIDFFGTSKMIPHPITSPCSRRLKIEPINVYGFENQIDIDLIGYVKHELTKRAGRQQEKITPELFELKKEYPIGDFTDEWCFDIVEKHIGWFPEIYKILDEKGKRIFKHNNCLPCKNMNTKDFENVKEHFPLYHAEAMRLSAELGKYWGRDKDAFYSTFGRDLEQSSTCENCKY